MKQIISTLLLLLSIPVCVMAQGWNESEYKQIESSIRMPEFQNKSFSIKQFGAKVNASAAANQKAINRAISTCSAKGGGTVVIPAGTWNTGALRMKSHVNLHLEEGATLLFAFQPELYPMVKTSWEGLGCWNYSPCIYAYEETDVAITGKGTIDGNGSRETWWPWCGATKFGYVEGETKESQKLGSRAQLLKYAEDGVPEDERKFGMGHEIGRAHV